MPDRQLTLRHGAVSLDVDLDAGGRVTDFTIGEFAILAHVDTSSPFHWGSFVMAPWAGRIRRGQFAFAGRDYQLPINFETHAIHGVLADRPWWKVEATDRMVVLDCPLDERWPWRGYVRQVITLDDGVATFEIEVHSDDEPFPASAGWHPWFRRSLTRGGPLEIEIDAESVLALDADGVSSSQRIEIPPQPWDHCFDHVKWPVTLTWPDALRLEVSGDTRYGVVYTELAEAICVEPQTGPPDAPTLEPVVVTPGRPLTATMTWTWTSG
jgi:aldose 1-epimerase